MKRWHRMKIKELILINWGNLPNQTYYFEDGLNLLVGDTGSGKSTMIDAIQTLLTASKRGLGSYNAGQGTEENHAQNKTYRTYASYLLGGDEGRRFSRSEAKGVVAIVFENAKDEHSSAWIYGDAYLEEGSRVPKLHEDMKMAIVRDSVITLEDFIYDGSEGVQVKSYAAIKNDMKNLYGANKLETFDSKKNYLGRLYGMFQGSSKSISERDTTKVAKAFTNYIYPREVRDAHRFVFNELLEKEEIKGVIEDLGTILQRSNNLKKEAKAYESAYNSLSQISFIGTQTLQAFQELYYSRYVSAARKVLQKERIVAKTQKSLKEQNKRRKKAEVALQKSDIKLVKLSEEIDSLKLKISQNSAYLQKQELEKEYQKLQQEQRKIAENIRIFFSFLEDAKHTFTISNKHLYLDTITQLVSAITDFSSKYKNSRTLQCSDTFISDALTLLEGIKTALNLEDENAFISQFYEKFATLESEQKQLQKQKELLQENIAKLSSGTRVSYPSNVEKAMSILHEALDEANPRVLCELFDFNDSSWQSSIEGYLGGNRFAIVVDTEYVVKANQIIKEYGLWGVKILQSARLLNDIHVKGYATSSDSIVDLLNFSDKIAQAYMILNYGNVVQVEDEEALSQSIRGVTKDGLGASGYTTYFCGLKAHECVVGARSKEHQLLHYKKELDALEQSMQSFRESLGFLRGPRNQLHTMMQNLPKVTTLESFKMLDIVESQIKTVAEQIANIDLGAMRSLEEMLISLMSEQKQESQERDKHHSEITTASNALKSLDDNLPQQEKNLSEELNAKESAKELFETSHTSLSESVLQALSVQFKEDIESKNDFDSKRCSFSDVQKLCFEFSNSIDRHNAKEVTQAFIEYATFDIAQSMETFHTLEALHKKIQTLHSHIEQNILFEKKNSLKESDDQFKQVFISSFCSSIYAQILQGKNRIKEIDRVLKRHRFETVYYTITTELNPLYKEYYTFFKKLSEEPSMESLFSEGLSLEQKDEVVTKINDMLLANDEKSELYKELMKLSDYRNYYKYDIKMVMADDIENATSLNEMATSSGGQAETSYYVIRSIAAYSSFGLDKRKKDLSALQFLCIDEGFSKVDEFRPEKILDFLVKDLGFQLITAMPTSRQSVFIDYATTRHMVMKEVLNSSLKEYSVNVEVEYDLLNTTAIKALKKADMQQIEMQFDA